MFLCFVWPDFFHRNWVCVLIRNKGSNLVRILGFAYIVSLCEFVLHVYESFAIIEKQIWKHHRNRLVSNLPNFFTHLVSTLSLLFQLSQIIQDLILFLFFIDILLILAFSLRKVYFLIFLIFNFFLFLLVLWVKLLIGTFKSVIDKDFIFFHHIFSESGVFTKFTV